MNKLDILALIVLLAIFACITWLLVFGGKSYHYVNKNDSKGVICVQECNYWQGSAF